MIRRNRGGLLPVTAASGRQITSRLLYMDSAAFQRGFQNVKPCILDIELDISELLLKKNSESCNIARYLQFAEFTRMKEKGGRGIFCTVSMK